MVYYTQYGGTHMAHERETIDITHNPDLVRLAETVRASNTPAVLRRDDEDIAVVMPLANGAKRRVKGAPSKRKSAADMAIFFSSFGGWKDVDTDRLKADISESRRRSIGPRPEL